MENPKVRFGVVHRFALAVLLVGILAMLGVVYYMGDYVAKDKQASILSKLKQSATDKIDKLDRFMDARLKDISILSDNDGIIADENATTAEKLEHLRHLEHITQMYASISIYDKDGIRIADTRGLGVGLNESSRGFMRAALSGKAYSSPKPEVSSALKLPAIYFSSPVYDKDGKISGAIAARVLSSRLGEVMGLTEDDRVELVDQDNLVLFSPYDKQEELSGTGDLLSDPNGILEESGGSSSAIIVPDNGKRNLYAVARETGFGNYEGSKWMLVIEEDSSAVLAPVDELRTQVARVGGVMVVGFVIIMLAVVFSLFISPLIEFVRVSAALEKGDYTVRVNVKSNNEIGALAASFNRAIERIEKMEEERKSVDKAKTQFLTITSHELRSPMTPMKAQLQMLDAGYLGKMNKKQKESVGIVIRNADRLDKILVDFLEISRIETARLKFEFKKADLASTAKEVAEYMQGYMPEKKIRIKLHMGKLPIIEADSDRVSQVLRNLISNAIKFSQEKSTVEIAAGVQGDFIQFSVKDSGVGISQENQKRLFEPFFQVDKTFSRSQQGTGLGLSICKGIIESQGGKIWLESNPGAGTTFYFTVPFEPVREMKSVRVLFSNKDAAEEKIKLAFKEFLGPLGEAEFASLKSQSKLTKEGVNAYLEDLQAKGIIPGAEKEKFKKAVLEEA